MSSPMVEFDNVTYCAGEKTILSDISFAVGRGEQTLILGNSGAGKSTILKLILGLIKPTQGEIRLMDTDMVELGEPGLCKVRRRCGIVFQEGALFDSLTVRENVSFFLLEYLKIPQPEIDRRVSEILHYLGLDKYHEYFPAQLSSGMKRRVAFARAIATRPELLLIDEPTSGLDPYNANRVIELIQNLQEQFQVNSIIVSHELHYFLDMIDRIIAVGNGKVAFNGEPDIDLLVQKNIYGFNNHEPIPEGNRYGIKQ